MTKKNPVHTVSGEVTKEAKRLHRQKQLWGSTTAITYEKEARIEIREDALSSGLSGSCTNGLIGHGCVSARLKRKGDTHLNLTGGKAQDSQSITPKMLKCLRIMAENLTENYNFQRSQQRL